jgi:hypothetical protein
MNNKRKRKKKRISIVNEAWWLKLAILATQEAEI